MFYSIKDLKGKRVKYGNEILEIKSINNNKVRLGRNGGITFLYSIFTDKINNKEIEVLEKE